MTSAPISIAIAGVTGTLGSLIATYLLQTTNATVHGLCRSSEKVTKLLTDYPDRFKVFSGSAVSLEDVRKGVAGCKTVICTYSNMERQLWVDSSKVLIAACDAEGVARFIPSKYTFDFRSLEYGEMPHKDSQLDVWKYLSDGNEKGTIKVKGVHILVGGFCEAFFKLWFNPESPKYWGTGNEKWDLSTYESTAQVVAKVAIDPECPTGFLKFRDFAASINEVAAAIGKIKGDGSPLPLLYQGTVDDAEKTTKAALAANANIYTYMDVGAMYYFQTPKFQLGDETDNYRYPDIKRMTLEDAIRKFAN